MLGGHFSDWDELKAMADMVYPDGTRIARGDEVRIDGRPEDGVLRVEGWRPLKGRVVLMGADGHLTEAEPWQLYGAIAGTDRHDAEMIDL